MRRGWSEIARRRENEVFAERLENRLHTIAIVLTTIVLGMRLVAGTRDLGHESDFGQEPVDASAAEAQSATFL